LRGGTPEPVRATASYGTAAGSPTDADSMLREHLRHGPPTGRTGWAVDLNP